ncbi:hypothetical protein LOD99_1192 [Oopsacas minuta]|uniref:Non-homologous end-joining factor 1 n=1 Tax=Oopsacas minuta TaxID=111878 RepID=A0AAV7K6Q0_9METZ|nr:hypothetical protein LOD99_1192 [Oopsacas minuta]
MSESLVWHFRKFSTKKFLVKFTNISEEKTYKFDVVDLQLRHWCEIPTHEQLITRCEELTGVELAPPQLILEMEQEVLYGQHGNTEVLNITDKQLMLRVNKLRTLKVNNVLFLDRVDKDFEKLDRRWVVDTFVPLLALYAHKNDPAVLLGEVKTFEIFGNESTRNEYFKYKQLLQEKENSKNSDAINSEISSSQSSAPDTNCDLTPPVVNKTTNKQTTAQTELEEQLRREELNRKRTIMPDIGKKKRRLL